MASIRMITWRVSAQRPCLDLSIWVRSIVSRVSARQVNLAHSSTTQLMVSTCSKLSHTMSLITSNPSWRTITTICWRIHIPSSLASMVCTRSSSRGRPGLSESTSLSWAMYSIPSKTLTCATILKDPLMDVHRARSLTKSSAPLWHSKIATGYKTGE